MVHGVGSCGISSDKSSRLSSFSSTINNNDDLKQEASMCISLKTVTEKVCKTSSSLNSNGSSSKGRKSSTFLFFAQIKHAEVRERLRKEGGVDQSAITIGQKVKEEWKALTPEDQRLWKKKSRLAKARVEKAKLRREHKQEDSARDHLLVKEDSTCLSSSSHHHHQSQRLSSDTMMLSDSEMYGASITNDDLIMKIHQEEGQEEGRHSQQEKEQQDFQVGTAAQTSKSPYCKLLEDDSFFLASKALSGNHQGDTSRQRASDYSLPKNVAARVATQVEDSIHELNELSTFLLPKKDQEQNVAPFHKHEVVLGGLVASGGFSDIYEINSFRSCSSCEGGFTSSQKLARSKILATYPAASDNDTLSPSTSPKYVVKHLRPCLIENPKAFKDASIDLAHEAQLLASAQHPNIIRMRGWSCHGTQGCNAGYDGFFIILDRLCETLEQRIHNTWSKQIKTPSSTQGQHLLLLRERLKVCSDVASALRYLHDQRVMYRDLKTNNMAFDRQGKIQLFDFGLAKEVVPSSSKPDENDSFHATGGVGTLRYMAPEVANRRPYNFKADVYGFTMVMYETLALKKPFDKYSEAMIRERAHDDIKRERPKLKSLIRQASSQPRFPSDIFKLINDGWAHNIAQRPTMKEVNETLQVLLLELDLPTPSKSLSSSGRSRQRLIRRRGSLTDFLSQTFRSNKHLGCESVDDNESHEFQDGIGGRKIGRSSSLKW